MNKRISLQVAAGAGILVLASACGSSDDEGAKKSKCDPGHIEEGGECILDPYRFEPAERLDVDNEVRYFTGDLTELDLPPPPKSGFRIVMEPQYVESGLDENRCQAWKVPDDLAHRWIYTAEMHASPGMHHANLYGLEISGREPQPYPKCRERADATIFGGFFTVLGGMDTSNVIVPLVLFANSTQVIGGERYALAPGYAYEIPENHEIMTDVHLQNTQPDTIRVEAAWDFYTMPKSEVTDPSVMFVWLFFDFLIPPRGKKTLTAECSWAGGDVAAIMPHTHQWATGFDTEFGHATPRAFDGAPVPGTFVSMDEPMKIYDRQGTGLADSDIQVYDPPVNTDATDVVKFQCHFENTTDHDMCFGIGENEMCFLFGYMSPPEKQRLGVIITENASCLTLNPADRGEKTFNVAQWAASQDHDPTVLQRLAKLGGSSGFSDGCR